MSIAKLALRCVLPVALFMTLPFCRPASGQAIDGVAIEFVSQNPIVQTVAAEVPFELVARDTLGNVITDWDTRGYSVSLTVRNSIAEVDTNIASCYSWDDGYSWTKLTVGGVPAAQRSPFVFDVDRSVFVNGRAAGVFQDSKAEAGISIEVSPAVAALNQTSPLMTFTEGDVQHYMLQITGAPHPESDTVYVQRLYELLVRPQDRYCNTVTKEQRPMFMARFSGEFDAREGDAGKLFGGQTTIAGDQRFLLLSRTVREEGMQAQWIQLLDMLNPAANGMTREYYVLPHAPYPFSVVELADSTEINLAASQDSTVIFRWERPSPPDPYHNCYQSVLDSTRYSDELRYTVFFFDAPTPERSISIDSDGGGLENQLTRSVAELRQILAHIHPHDISHYERVLWRVEATDGLTVTTSNPSGVSQLPFYRLFFLETETDASATPRPATLRLHQNYPNPFNPTTVIRFDLPSTTPVTLLVTDVLGREISLLADQVRMEAGTHSLSFDAAGIPSGVYLYTLKTKDAVVARRMVVMK
ncbi:MAG: T9SS type A sorting domain-containing protein [Bacteroidetes bacterium]|nr:T9SS type A sorting domain-containing protein [Bacteroidota bacterium]